MQKYFIVLIVSLCIQSVQSQLVYYSPAWFGPNANPVPESSNGKINKFTSISLSGNYYFGFGDETKNFSVKAEVPLLAEKVSLSVWTTLPETYKVTPELALLRNMQQTEGTAKGDIYVQTKFLILEEKTFLPRILGRISLKTAAGDNMVNRRFFDTPGYYFDFELLKKMYTNKTQDLEISTILNLGFMSWETNNSVQNDAPLYGFNLLLTNEKYTLENSLSGYYGWMSIKKPMYGDRPLVYTGKLNYQAKKTKYYLQYQYGIKDFPYHHLAVGTEINLEKLTPHYK